MTLTLHKIYPIRLSDSMCCFMYLLINPISYYYIVLLYNQGRIHEGFFIGLRRRNQLLEVLFLGSRKLLPPPPPPVIYDQSVTLIEIGNTRTSLDKGRCFTSPIIICKHAYCTYATKCGVMRYKLVIIW